MVGQVRWFNEKKGFGFIQAEDQSDVFVHINQVKNSGLDVLTAGQNVEFTTRECTDGKVCVETISVVS